MSLAAGPARFFYITGCDGAGKSTHAAVLAGQLRQAGRRVSHVWLRFPFFLSIPLLAYARWRKYSWSEEHAGLRFGYWSFSRSRLLRHLLPWTLLLDAALLGLWRIRLPLWLGRTIVCERYVLDMLVDLSIAFDDRTFANFLPGRLYLHLLPRNAQVVILDLDVDTIVTRRPELAADRILDWKVESYRALCREHNLTCLPNRSSQTQVSAAICQLLLEKRRGSKSISHLKGYGGFHPGRLGYWLLRRPLLALASHWCFQGMLYMGATERWFKLALDLGLTVILASLARLWIGWTVATVTAWLIAHTLNALFNGHLWGALKHFGYVHTSRETYIHYRDCLDRRIQAESSIWYAAAYGSLCRREWQACSDLDVRLVRAPGLSNGFRAAFFVMKERSRALMGRFPLDIYVVDNWQDLEHLGLAETPMVMKMIGSRS